MFGNSRLLSDGEFGMLHVLNLVRHSGLRENTDEICKGLRTLRYFSVEIKISIMQLFL